MVLKNSLNYPYPMLKSEAIDYKQDTIFDDINHFTNSEGHVLNISIQTKNNNINNLISNKKAIKGILVKSSAVWFKKFFDLSESNEILLKSNEVYGKVELLPCIVANDDIDNYYSNDFYDEYKGINIKINKGELLAIGEEKIFNAELENDIFKNTSSIFEIQRGMLEELTFDLNEDKIIIYLPIKIKELYGQIINKDAQSLKAILNSTIVFPALVSALYEIQKDPDAYEDRKWYKTIMKTIELKKQNKSVNGLDVDGKILSPIQVAQGLTKGLTEIALIDIKNLIENYNLFTEGFE